MNERGDDAWGAGWILAIAGDLGALCCFLPFVLSAGAIGWLGSAPVVASLGVGILAIAATALFRRDRERAAARASNLSGTTEMMSTEDDNRHETDDCCSPQWARPTSEVQQPDDTAPLQVEPEKKRRLGRAGVAGAGAQASSDLTEPATT